MRRFFLTMWMSCIAVFFLGCANARRPSYTMIAYGKDARPGFSREVVSSLRTNGIDAHGEGGLVICVYVSTGNVTKATEILRKSFSTNQLTLGSSVK
jgi:hypothetical protein